MGTIWRRLSIESRVSLVGSSGIAFFLLIVSILQAVFSGGSRHAASILVVILHVILVLVMGWVFAQILRDVLTHRGTERWSRWLLALAVPVLGVLWLSDWTLGCVWAAAVLLVGGGGWGLGALAALLANQAVEELVLGDNQNFLLTVTLTIFTAFAIYIPIRLLETSDRLLLAQEEVARLHVDRERERISRDLHDIMGRTLVAVSLRQQAAARLLQIGRADDAATQLDAAHRIVDDGQATLRALTHGPTIADLSSEIAAARDLCERTGIAWDAQVGEVGTPDAQRLCAAVLRESVTNMLKYSRPSTCWVRLRDEGETLALSVVNDGVPPDAKVNEAGTGLSTLQQRTVALGGTLEALSPRPGLFRVLVHLPVFIEEGP